MARTIVFIPSETIPPLHANTDGENLRVDDLGPMTLDGIDGRLWGLNSPEEPVGRFEQIRRRLMAIEKEVPQ